MTRFLRPLLAALAVFGLVLAASPAAAQSTRIVSFGAGGGVTVQVRLTAPISGETDEALTRPRFVNAIGTPNAVIATVSYDA